MKNFCRKYRNMLSVAVFIVLASPLFYFVTRFFLNNIEIKADKIQEKIIDNQLTQKKIENIPQMEKTAAEFEDNHGAIETILNADAYVEFIKYLENLADSTGNSITIQMLEKKKNSKVAPKVVAEDGAETVVKPVVEKTFEEKLGYKKYISMQINLIGDYSAFLNFLHKLENNQYYANVVALTLKKDVATTDLTQKNDQLMAGDVFQVPVSPVRVIAPPEVKNILKSTLTVDIYTQ